MIQRIKGTIDWLDLQLFNVIIERISKHLSCYNFHQIKTPILEPTTLFQRSLGTTTDVVNKEMFIIKSAEHEDDICLRPEATASTARAFIEHAITELPWRVFSWGPMFRYERPQKGRYREFHQISIEMIGAQSISYDAEFIKMLDRFFHETCKLDNYALIINFLGSYEDRATYKLLLKQFLDAQDATAICSTCTTRKESNIMRIFDCKNPICQTTYRSAPKVIDHLSQESQQEWQLLQAQLDLLSVSYTINPLLVRGLDYYNKTVFEFVSNDLGAQNTFCGGGRYDSLIKELSEKQSQPAIGAAIGIERLLLLLEPIQDRLLLPTKPSLTVILPLSQQQINLAMLIADELHAQQICTEILLDNSSMKSMMRKANRMGATYAVIIGEDEQNSHEVTVKNMINGTEKRIKQIELVAYVK